MPCGRRCLGPLAALILLLATQPFVGGLVLDAPEETPYGVRGPIVILYTNGRYEVQYAGL